MRLWFLFQCLKLLQLIGLGCPWNLTDLELQHYAFRGREWEIESGCFLKLDTLVIEDTDSVRWRAQRGSLPRLDILSIRHCYKLQELDWARDPSTDRTPTIELVNCNLSFNYQNLSLKLAAPFLIYRRSIPTWLTGLPSYMIILSIHFFLYLNVCLLVIYT